MSRKIKRGQSFAIFVKDLKFQVVKKTKSETDLRNVIPINYHNLFNVFLKKNLDII